MSKGFLSMPIHLETEGSLWVPTYSHKYDLLGILLYKTLRRSSVSKIPLILRFMARNELPIKAKLEKDPTCQPFP